MAGRKIKHFHIQEKINVFSERWKTIFSTIKLKTNRALNNYRTNFMKSST